jgi:uncharacterized protein YdiU (UPF0061 family)
MPIAPNYQPMSVFPELGREFADPVKAASFPKHVPRFRNQEWAQRVGLGEFTDKEWEKHFALFEPLPRNLPQPLALRYHGHQFRSYNPDLGDGRGFLFAQMRDTEDGRLLDLGTKGSGQTPYSRTGDGRLTLKGSVREILATEMLESLGVYTSKTFSVFETGESLERNDEPSPTRAGVLVRLNHSHVRFGTFQRQAAEQAPDRIRQLIDYCIRYYYPKLEGTPEAERPAQFLREVAVRSANLTAQWMIAGFVHGVLNTDNMNVTGESFDYGPYRFLPTYDPSFTAAYFDQTGLYAYGRQPESVLWNLEQLAGSLSQVSKPEPLVEALHAFAFRFNDAIVEKLVDRLGLESTGEAEKDGELFIAAFNFLAESQAGFEQFFHDWYGGTRSEARAARSPQALLYKGEHFEAFRKRLQTHAVSEETVRRLDHPYFANEKPCSLLIDEIEWIWEAIAANDDWSRLENKVAKIRERGRVYGKRHV